MRTDDGKRLLERLIAEGIAVTAACWLKESEGGQWFLYIATPLVSEDGAKRKAYRRVRPVIQQMPQPFWIDPFEIKVISPNSPIARAVQDLHRRYPVKSVIPFGAGQFGGMSIEGAYVYPPIPVVDQQSAANSGAK